VPFVALVLWRVRQADSGAASSVVNVAPLVGGSVGIAALGTVAWTTAAHRRPGPCRRRRPVPRKASRSRSPTARHQLPKSHRIDRTALPFETVVQIILTASGDVPFLGRVLHGQPACLQRSDRTFGSGVGSPDVLGNGAAAPSGRGAAR
jgi:hypothetical protein